MKPVEIIPYEKVIPVFGKTPAAQCQCLKCGSKWHVTAPIMTDDLECNHCYEIKHGLREDEYTIAPYTDTRDGRGE